MLLYRLYMYCKLQKIPSSCQCEMKRQRSTATSRKVAADTSTRTLSDLSDSVSFSTEGLRFSLSEAPRINSCWSNSNFVAGLSLSRECTDWRLPRRLCDCCCCNQLASAFVRYQTSLEPYNCWETNLTVKNELSIRCGTEGKRKITTRSSSTLDASSGMVSGKANSFGDETQEFYQTSD